MGFGVLRAELRVDRKGLLALQYYPFNDLRLLLFHGIELADRLDDRPDHTLPSPIN